MAGALQNLASSAKGMFFDGAGEKAVLYVLNPKYDTLSDAEIGQVANSLVQKLRGGATDNGILEKAKEKLNPAGAAANEDYGFANDANGKAVGVVSSQQKEFIKIEVQYNPQSIRMYSAIGKQQELDRKDNGMNRLIISNLSGKTRMSFDLIFDDMDIVDSFMLDGVPVNITGVVNKGIDAFKHRGTKHSVRKQMDAIMSLLSSLRTQQVIFAWSKMTFRGMLTNVTNTYTMFNTEGNPVRGTMHIEITQESKEDNIIAYDKTEWEKAFKNRFSQSDSVGKKSTASKILNNGILNIDI